MLSSGYAILYQQGKRYVHRAIFYLNKEQVFQDFKDDFLNYLLITRYLCLEITYSI
jgi:hypothetical protein